MEPLKFFMEYKPGDAEEYLYNGYRRQQRLESPKRTLARLAVVWAIALAVAAVGGVLALVYRDNNMPFILLAVFALAVGLFVAYFFLRRRRELDGMKAEMLRVGSEVRIDEQGGWRKRMDDSGTASFTWGEVDFVKITPRLYMFFKGDWAQLVVPKSALDAELQAAFEAYIDTYLLKKKVRCLRLG